jgi:hypothetical protein
MATKRRKVAAQSRTRITPEAVACWKQGDYWGLWRALGLRLWQMPDWTEDPPDADDRPASMRSRWPQPDCTALKAQLIAIAGPPPRRWWFRRDDAGKLVDDGFDD